MKTAREEILLTERERERGEKVKSLRTGCISRLKSVFVVEEKELVKAKGWFRIRIQEEKFSCR